eukprot:CAMPEP_0175050328 /NCGR_PEP_ID=MMETSP0052_2-20121109/7202_1 /TAXON_ID=51329 ORGANISM="Polytomella parva, Strain SAG 63-3" /NCGR_SAMPLE_ID=MMETSP0052_2 /ASSEMBLY_ACC=CAM_ASM_000194 /LENGTH=655 /DNA_ID=CAMNT_0016314527 /DNA_START=104 /DNA_END=2067 /DNA_ORIENTATION=+
MSYILLVNPQILSKAGLPLHQVVASTALTSSIASFCVGIFANLPVGIAPGMGLNAYLVFSQVLGSNVSISSALACCATASVLVGILSILHALSLILRLVPNSIKLATVVGMGLLLSLIGLQQSGVVVRNKDTMVGLGNVFQVNALLSMFGLAIIAGLHYRNVKGSILIGILLCSITFWALEDTWPQSVFAPPSFRLFALDFSAIRALDANAMSAVTAYALVMVFDIGGAMYGLGKLAGLIGPHHENSSNGEIPGAVPTYLSAAVATLIGAFTGTTPLIIAAESAVGIKEGGRTGLVAVTISFLFALALFFAPILQSVPSVATAPVLVLVGTMMMGESTHVDWTSMLTAIPAFLTIVVQPFTFSISNGIYAGLVMTLLLHISTGHIFQTLHNVVFPPPSPYAHCTNDLFLLDAASDKVRGEGGGGGGGRQKGPSTVVVTATCVMPVATATAASSCCPSSSSSSNAVTGAAQKCPMEGDVGGACPYSVAVNNSNNNNNNNNYPYTAAFHAQGAYVAPPYVPPPGSVYPSGSAYAAVSSSSPSPTHTASPYPYPYPYSHPYPAPSYPTHPAYAPPSTAAASTTSSVMIPAMVSSAAAAVSASAHSFSASLRSSSIVAAMGQRLAAVTPQAEDPFERKSQVVLINYDESQSHGMGAASG